MLRSSFNDTNDQAEKWTRLSVNYAQRPKDQAVLTILQALGLFSVDLVAWVPELALVNAFSIFLCINHECIALERLLFRDLSKILFLTVFCFQIAIPLSAHKYADNLLCGKFCRGSVLAMGVDFAERRSDRYQL